MKIRRTKLQRLQPRHTGNSHQAKARRRTEKRLNGHMTAELYRQLRQIKSNANRGRLREANTISGKRKRLLIAEAFGGDPNATPVGPPLRYSRPTKDLLYLYPSDCYKQLDPRCKVPLLQQEAYDDVVARIENAHLAGMQIPPHFTANDLYLAYIPTRRVVAFAYATILPNVLDNFRKAVKVAQLPCNSIQKEVYQSTEAMHWLSSFWRERIKARSGVAMLFAEKYAKAGSPQHLKLYAELTGEKPPDAPSKTEVNISMPYGSTAPNQKQLAEQTPIEAEYEDLTEEPS